MTVLAAATEAFPIIGSIVGILGGLGGLAAAAHRLITIRADNRKLDSEAKVNEANVESITQEGWAKLIALQREQIARGEVTEARLRQDMDDQRTAFEERMTTMQRRMDRMEQKMREAGVPIPA